MNLLFSVQCLVRRDARALTQHWAKHRGSEEWLRDRRSTTTWRDSQRTSEPLPPCSSFLRDGHGQACEKLADRQPQVPHVPYCSPFSSFTWALFTLDLLFSHTICTCTTIDTNVNQKLIGSYHANTPQRDAASRECQREAKCKSDEKKHVLNDRKSVTHEAHEAHEATGFSDYRRRGPAPKRGKRCGEGCRTSIRFTSSHINRFSVLGSRHIRAPPENTSI